MKMKMKNKGPFNEPQKGKEMIRRTRKALREMADTNGRICKKGRKTPTLRIYEDGTIIRADTDLTLCRAMTVTEAFSALGIK